MSHSLFDDQPRVCPWCENPATVPIVYREPNEEMLTAEKLGHIMLRDPRGVDQTPEWHCTNPMCLQDF